MEIKDTSIVYIVGMILGIIMTLASIFLIDSVKLEIIAIFLILFCWVSMKLDSIYSTVEYMRLSRKRVRHHDPSLDEPRVNPISDVSVTKRPPRYRD